jgi:hypothetical protein
MKGKIYLSSELRGRLGNQLFRINMALQLSTYFDVSVSLPLNKYTNLFNLPNIRRVSWDRIRTHEGSALKCEEFLSSETCTLLGKIERCLLNGKDIIIPPDLLGQGFDRYCFFKPKELISLKHKPAFREFNNSVAIHFRGTDFSKWNPLAVMNTDFYMQSIELLKIGDLSVNIFSDDLESLTVKSLIECIPKSKLFPSVSLQKTFSALSQHRYIIASPSTFSLWAAILGQPSVFVISKKWITLMESAGDNFWPQLVKNDRLGIDKVLAV